MHYLWKWHSLKLSYFAHFIIDKPKIGLVASDSCRSRKSHFKVLIFKPLSKMAHCTKHCTDVSHIFTTLKHLHRFCNGAHKVIEMLLFMFFGCQIFRDGLTRYNITNVRERDLNTDQDFRFINADFKGLTSNNTVDIEVHILLDFLTVFNNEEKHLQLNLFLTLTYAFTHT